MRKFTDWFYSNDNARLAFLKVDAKIPDPRAEGIIYISAILRLAHPRMSQFVQVFQSFGEITK